MFEAMLALVVCGILGAAAVVAWQRRLVRVDWRTIDPAILKNGGSAKKLRTFCAEKPVDYIIVGSGLGGLTAASLLSAAGFRVLVLEQHDVAGGATHTFELDGYEWDVGFHYIGENVGRWWSPLRKLFAVVAPDLEWSALDADYDFAVNEVTGQKIPISSDPKMKFETLARSCGDYDANVEALRKYKRACTLAKGSAASLFLFKLLPRWAYPRRALGWAWDWGANRSAVDVMRRCGMSDELIGAATYLYGNYGEGPGRAPFVTQALLETHFDGGGFFPRGGSSVLAKSLVSAIRRNGSAVFVRAPVDAVVVEGGAAVGVVCKGERLECSRGVISNAGAANTYERLVPKAVGRPCVAALRETTSEETSEAPRATACDPSVALAYVFVGLDGSDVELRLPACNYWCLRPGGASHWDHDRAMANISEAAAWGDAPPAAVFLSFGSSKDDSHAERHPGTATLQLLAPVNYAWFEKWETTKLENRGADYEALKAEIRDYLLEHYLYKHFPQTRGRVKTTEVATPCEPASLSSPRAARSSARAGSRPTSISTRCAARRTASRTPSSASRKTPSSRRSTPRPT